MTRHSRLLLLSHLVLVLWAVGNVYADEVITLNTGRGVRQSFLLAEPRDKPQGVVLMFPGDDGVVQFVKGKDGYRLDHDGAGLTGNKKAIETYRSSGLVAAIVAPPSDKEGGMTVAFRASDEHLTDIRMVIDYLRQKYGQKIYLHGHCLGGHSPASITAKLKNEGIAGLILSSPRSVSVKKQRSALTDYQKVVSVPVLLIQHKQDSCPGTSHVNLALVQSHYEQSSNKVDSIVVSGGDIQMRRSWFPCKNGAHAFRGLEEEVTGAISNWILGKEFPRQINGS